MNQPDKAKKKFTYFEHKEVFAALQEMADEETKQQGRVVTVPEIIRRNQLIIANKYLSKNGKKPIDYDTSAGKFAPGGVWAAAEAIVSLKGSMTVFDKQGNKMTQWKKVEDIPNLLRQFPKCRVRYLTPV